jgi:hypothetical protein
VRWANAGADPSMRAVVLRLERVRATELATATHLLTGLAPW